MPALALLLLAATLPASAADSLLPDLRSTLAHGLWNDRIHAVHGVGTLGVDGLPLLEFAAADADWQVRLAAVHYLGRLGEPGIPALASVLADEPCRHVRISAIHWLGSMGEPAAPVLERALDDESRMLRMEDRYWLDKMGRAPKQTVLDAAAEQNTGSYEDLKRCESSSLGGRLKRAAAKETPAETPLIRSNKEAPSSQVVESAPPPDYRETLAAGRNSVASSSTPAVPPGSPVPPRDAAFDGFLGLGPPQTLPPGAPLANREEPPSEADLLAASPRAAPTPALTSPAPTASRETLPPGAPAPARADSERPAAGFQEDAGSPKPDSDPIPSLIAQLKAVDPRVRARAADELGKRGAQAAPALPALRRELKDKVGRVRASAALALGNLGDAAAIGDLARAAKDANEDVRWSAAVALGRIKTPAARAAFRKLTGQPQPAPAEPR